ncbi:MAG TPA: transglycosylase family protein [Egibacteraceae bacterium]|nr:transglycosylase family protein [Egibacteraceae bacterium]
MSGKTLQSNAARPRRTRAAATVTAVTLGLTGALPGAALAAETYRVKSGDTLQSIAEDHGYKGINAWRRLFDANRKIDNPDLIVPGQRLTVPDKGEKVKRRALPAAEAVAPRREGAAASRSSETTTTTTAPSGGVWYSLAQCESGGNWSINTGNGYYGGLQFSLSSWRAVGGSGYPHEHSASTQIAMGQRLQAQQGWGAWPACAAKLGLR